MTTNKERAEETLRRIAVARSYCRENWISESRMELEHLRIILKALDEAEARGRESGIREAANVTESMIVGGRMHTDGQAIAADALGAAAKTILALLEKK